MNHSSAIEIDGAEEAFLIPTPTSGEVSLYFHIPFCTKKCDYCHFFVLPNKEELHDELVSALILEWHKKKNLIQDRSIVSIYFGGGTPALLSPILFEKLLNEIPFTPATEITLEANPENLTLELLRGFKKVGINRLSIGAQSFDDHLLKVLSRAHDSQKTCQTLEWAEMAGFSNISLDLMYDIPEQTEDMWKKTVEIASKQPITHLSLYNLTIEPETVFFKKRKMLASTIPCGQSSLAMYKTAIEFFPKFGLHPYEISAFAKQGYYSKHNTGYWMARDFLGMGPSAHSYWNQNRFSNPAHFGKYKKALSEGLDPAINPDNLTKDERKRELLAVEIRLRQGIHLPSFERRHGKLTLSSYSEIESLIQKGWLQKERNTLKLTPQGILFYDSVATELI